MVIIIQIRPETEWSNYEQVECHLNNDRKTEPVSVA